jgi:hypothetical protein
MRQAAGSETATLLGGVWPPGRSRIGIVNVGKNSWESAGREVPVSRSFPVHARSSPGIAFRPAIY